MTTTTGKRRKTPFFDRIKVTLFLVIVSAFFIWKDVNDPFVTTGDAFADFAATTLGRILLGLLAVEILRQVHYLVSEHWAGYNRLWADRIFEGTNRQVTKRFGDFTRFRVRRVARWAVLVVIYAYLAMLLRDDIGSPAEAITRAPDIFLDLLPIILQFAFYGALVMFQFVAIFWFLSRGGIDIVFPEDIETRFDKVWGQDHVLSHIKENIAFLEKPDEIEAKGGYIPGGILLWGPPGTGKTLIAEAIAGEVGKPFVFVDPGAFIQMFFGVGILKVKRLFRKLRKLSLKHGGVVVFFDEADSLGSRGMSLGGTPPTEGALGEYLSSCNGFSYLSPATQHSLLEALGSHDTTAAPRGGLVNRVVMGAGMGGGGMGTLQALLTEISGLTKPRGLSNRIRRILGMKPKLPPKYRILIMMATNMPGALDPALLRPGRIDRMYKVGYPSKDGRLRTFQGYLAKVKHNLTPEEVDKVAVTTPYFSGAKIKDLVNEALIHAIREGREQVTFADVWHAKALKQFGPPDDHEYVVRERWAVAIHEASHAVAAHLLRTHAAIDIVTIERRGDTGGFVSNIPIEDRFTAWRSEKEADIKTSLASLAGERLFFGHDNSSGVTGDLMAATRTAAAMEGVWGMGDQLSSFLGLSQSAIGAGPDPTDRVLRSLGPQVERKLQTLYDEVYALLEEHREQVLQLAGVLVDRKTISGDDVAEIMGTPQGSRTIHRPQGFIAFDPEGGDGGDVSRYTSIPSLPKSGKVKKAKAKKKKKSDDDDD
ncbi:MAG: AAA family ATPase [Acidimicrobiia bacterium]|nr:AAA family ATPase [Acidimicrobiia bacterium]